jgi:hypothetical protein
LDEEKSMKSLKLLALGAATAAMIAGAGLAAAQDAGPQPGPGARGPMMMDRGPMGGEHRGGPGRLARLLDTNGDGKVTLDEITAEEGRLFGAADVNGDGALSSEEFRRRGMLFMQLRAFTLFDLLDANGDGKLTKEEIAAPSARWFARYDTNKDGVLDADELRQMMPQRTRR